MKLHLDGNPGTNRITGYGEGYVSVNDERLTASCIVAPDSLTRDWEPSAIGALTPEHMEAVLALEPEIVLLGTGARQQFPDLELFDELAGRGIGLEVMDTPAACRTYNILVGEGRTVVAALILARA